MSALAELCGTTQQQIDRLEKSKRKLTAEWMEKLSKALSCAPTDLVNFETESASTDKKQKTVSAKIIGAIETKFSNMIRKFEEDEVYELSIKPPSGSGSDKFFGLVVEGGAYGKYPENSELIFSEVASTPKQQALAEGDSEFSAQKQNEKLHRFEIGDNLISAELIKSIRNE